MANKNDEKILVLKKQIAEKKDKLGKISRFTPSTNLSIELDGARFNINVLNKDQLTHLMVKLNSLLISAKQLNIANNYEISGYNVEDWIGDIQLKLNILSKKDEERNLALMEAKLSKMLSDEKQIELELEEMASLLGND